MTSQDEFDRRMRQAAGAFDRVEPVADEVMRRIGPTEPTETGTMKQNKHHAFCERSFRMKRAMRIAAACLIGAVLVAAGWASEKVYKKVADKKTPTRIFKVEEESATKPTMVLPDGRKFHTASGSVTSISSDDPEVNLEKAKQQHEEMKKLIARKKYEFVRKFRDAPGDSGFIYRFTLSDGTEMAMNFSMRLEGVKSYEEYKKKDAERQRRRRKEIEKAIAKGSFRLINVDVILVHLCKDTKSGKKLDVQRIVLPDGERVALVSSHPAHKSQDQFQIDWKAHLQSIKDGERQLLDVRLTRSYSYEVTLADGSTTIFSYGGGDPLEKGKGEKKSQ